MDSPKPKYRTLDLTAQAPGAWKSRGYTEIHVSQRPKAAASTTVDISGRGSRLPEQVTAPRSFKARPPEGSPPEARPQDAHPQEASPSEGRPRSLTPRAPTPRAPTPRLPMQAIRRGTPVAADVMVAIAAVPRRVAPAPHGREAARRLEARNAHLSWRPHFADRARTWFGDLEVLLWIGAILTTVAIATPFVLRVVPASIRANKASEQLTTGYRELFEAEERELKSSGHYADPAWALRHEGIAALEDPDFEVVQSTSDANHWFLQMRSARSGAVCTALSMTFLNRRGGGFRYSCTKEPREEPAAPGGSGR